MSEWVAVVQEEGDEPIEIPSEPDGTIILTSLTAQFPGVTGLKFRNPDTNGLRGVRCLDNQLFPPYEDGWGNITYICVFPKLLGSPATKKEQAEAAQLKRKSENDGGVDGMSSKNQRVEDMDESGGTSKESAASASSSKTTDLIVLGLPWKTTEDEIREYFEAFGELLMVQLKTRVGTNQSKGFAFIRFADINVQNKVVLTRHLIDGRWCDVKVPDSQELKSSKLANSCKIFVGRITEVITPDDIRGHFEAFGTVTDIYIPKPFRSFAFVTFSENKVAQSLLGKEHTIKGVSVHIGSAHSKSRESGSAGSSRNNGSRYDNYGGGGSGGGGGGSGSYHSPMDRYNQSPWAGSHSPSYSGGGGGGGRGGPGPKGNYYM